MMISSVFALLWSVRAKDVSSRRLRRTRDLSVSRLRARTHHAPAAAHANGFHRVRDHDRRFVAAAAIQLFAAIAAVGAIGRVAALTIAQLTNAAWPHFVGAGFGLGRVSMSNWATAVAAA